MGGSRNSRRDLDRATRLRLAFERALDHKLVYGAILTFHIIVAAVQEDDLRTAVYLVLFRFISQALVVGAGFTLFHFIRGQEPKERREVKETLGERASIAWERACSPIFGSKTLAVIGWFFGIPATRWLYYFILNPEWVEDDWKPPRYKKRFKKH